MEGRIHDLVVVLSRLGGSHLLTKYERDCVKYAVAILETVEQMFYMEGG